MRRVTVVDSSWYAGMAMAVGFVPASVTSVSDMPFACSQDYVEEYQFSTSFHKILHPPFYFPFTSRLGLPCLCIYKYLVLEVRPFDK